MYTNASEIMDKLTLTVKVLLCLQEKSGDPCKCKMNCYITVSAADRAKLLEEFNSLASFEVQNGYLHVHGLIKSFEPKRCYTSKGKNGKR